MTTIVIQRSISTSTMGMVRAKSHVEAELVARTMMTSPIGLDESHDRRGRLGAYDWTIGIEPLLDPVALDARTPFALVRMTVSVAQAGQSVALVSAQTVRMVRTGEP